MYVRLFNDWVWYIASASYCTGSEWTWREDIFIIRSDVMNHAVHIWTGRWLGAAVGGELLVRVALERFKLVCYEHGLWFFTYMYVIFHV